MVTAFFEHEGNRGLLVITTHFGKTFEVPCEKRDGEIFRLGGTGINEVMVYEGLVLRIPAAPPFARFRAFRSPEVSFEDTGVMSDEEWDESNRHCWVTEYYDLEMEGKRAGWIISKSPIVDAHHLFVNLDVLDGGGNIIRRYRCSPFFTQYRVLEMN